MREYQPHSIPATRLIYGQPAPIWLERTTGPLRAASVCVDEEIAEGLGPGTWETGACATGADFFRVQGGHQGCPIATRCCGRRMRMTPMTTVRRDSGEPSCPPHAPSAGSAGTAVSHTAHLMPIHDRGDRCY